MDTGKSWVYMPRNCPQYREGVDKFIITSLNTSALNGRVKCPCKRCAVTVYLDPKVVREHLICEGFDKNYANSIWIFHGEEPSPSRLEDESSTDEEFGEGIDDMNGLLHDAFGNYIGENPQADEGWVNLEAQKFHKLMQDAKTKLYPGCDKFTTLSFILRLYQMKCLHRWSDTSLNDMLQFLNDLLPNGSDLPKNLCQMKKIIADLGLGYTKIDACPNDCMLYWKTRVNDEKCNVCQTSRWKDPLIGKKSGPAKVLRHFPLIPRLKRLFMSSKTSDLMRWHKRGRSKDGKQRHPVDSLAWKHFDDKYPEFALDARNIRLGLASDGFNPFSNMSSNHSTWPVVLMVYNLPPWLCMKDSYFIMSLLIPGPKAPGNDIDIYLQPLIHELIELWNGVETYDASTNNSFMLCAPLMWTINDLPAFGNLSGWKTKGYLACPYCNVDTSSYRLKNSKKLCYLGHRCLLDINHPFRRCKAAFNGKVEQRPPSKLRSGDDLLYQMRKIKVIFGKHNKKPKNHKRKRKGSVKKKSERNGWKKESIFFTLPYWKDHLLRHNIDVMHTEKNVCESLLGTLLNIEGKTKDTLAARFDLKDMKIRPKQHPVKVGDKYEKPRAPFFMDAKAKENFCKVLSSVKVPDGCASNISRRVDVKNGKLSGLKSHDCHIIMQQLLPLAVRKALPKEISVVLIEVSNIFKELCSKEASFDDFEKLEQSAILTLCRLERIFPPSFFDIMVHLVSHLSYEAAIGGPVHFRWMYPIERFLFKLKSFVHNRAKPEGSIAEAYIANESMVFCARYMQEVESRTTNYSDRERKGLSIFSIPTHVFGCEDNIHLSHQQRIQAHEYVLFNCDEVAKYAKEHRNLLRQQHLHIQPSDLEKLHKERFVKWLQVNGEHLFQVGDEQSNEDLQWLSRGPSSLARQMKKIVYNGFKFRTKDIEKNSPTQNSGIGVYGEGGVIYYGVLKYIYDLDYYEGRKVVLLKCDWVDMRNGKGIKEDILGFTLVNFKNLWKTNEPYVLASQAFQVFYTPDPVETNWNVVSKIKPRDVYDMDEVAPEGDTTTYFDSELHTSGCLETTIVALDNFYMESAPLVENEEDSETENDSESEESSEDSDTEGEDMEDSETEGDHTYYDF